MNAKIGSKLNIRGVSFSIDDQYIASGGDDKIFRIWETDGPEEKCEEID